MRIFCVAVAAAVLVLSPPAGPAPAGGAEPALRAAQVVLPLPGRKRVRVVKEEDDLAAVAAAIAPGLAELARRFEQERQELVGQHTWPPGGFEKAAQDLVDRTESALLDRLPAPPLAALRDYVQASFERFRGELRAADEGAPAQGRLPPRAGPALARVAGPGSTAPPWLKLIDRTQALLGRITGLAQGDRLATRLCVTSAPVTRAQFSMRPRSYHPGVRELLTSGQIGNVTRGLYSYKVEKRGRRFQEIRCGWDEGGEERWCLDLMTESDQMLECDLVEGLCRQRDLPPGGCPGR